MNRINPAPSIVPAFTLSCERSGSTLLRYIIDTHPEIVSPGELALGQLCCDLELVVSRTLGEISTPANEREHQQLVLAEVRRIVSDLMNTYTRAKHKRIWCEKTPANLRHLDILKDVFPDAKYICLHRHCLDVVHSCIECSRLGFMFELAEYIRKDPEHVAAALVKSWIDKTRTLLAFERRYPSQCFRIKYESLVQNPATTLAPLFTFLGVSWDARLLDSVFSVHHDQGGGDVKVRYVKSIHTGAIGNGVAIPRECIPDHRLEEMNRLLEALDYPVVGPDWGHAPAPSRGSYPAPRRDTAPQCVDEIFSNYLPKRIAAARGMLQALNVVYKVVVTGDRGGTWMIDLTKPANQVTSGDGRAHCTISISQDDLLGITNGRLKPMEAFRQGKLRIAGDLSLMEPFGEIFM